MRNDQLTEAQKKIITNYLRYYIDDPRLFWNDTKTIMRCFNREMEANNIPIELVETMPEDIDGENAVLVDKTRELRITIRWTEIGDDDDANDTH